MVEKVLLDHDANIDATDKHGSTALMWAAFRGRNDVLETLIHRGGSNGIISCGELLNIVQVNS